MALSPNEWIELALGVLAITGTVFAANKWYYDRIRDEIREKSTTNYLKVLVDENSKNIKECKTKIALLEQRVIADISRLKTLSSDTEEIKKIVSDFSALKESINLLHKNYSDLQRMIFFRLSNQGKPPS